MLPTLSAWEGREKLKGFHAALPRWYLKAKMLLPVQYFNCRRYWLNWPRLAVKVLHGQHEYAPHVVVLAIRHCAEQFPPLPRHCYVMQKGILSQPPAIKAEPAGLWRFLSLHVLVLLFELMSLITLGKSCATCNPIPPRRPKSPLRRHSPKNSLARQQVCPCGQLSAGRLELRWTFPAASHMKASSPSLAE